LSPVIILARTPVNKKKGKGQSYLEPNNTSLLKTSFFLLFTQLSFDFLEGFCEYTLQRPKRLHNSACELEKTGI